MSNDPFAGMGRVTAEEYCHDMRRSYERRAAEAFGSLPIPEGADVAELVEKAAWYAEVIDEWKIAKFTGWKSVRQMYEFWLHVDHARDELWAELARWEDER